MSCWQQKRPMWKDWLFLSWWVAIQFLWSFQVKCGHVIIYNLINFLRNHSIPVRQRMSMWGFWKHKNYKGYITSSVSWHEQNHSFPSVSLNFNHCCIYSFLIGAESLFAWTHLMSLTLAGLSCAGSPYMILIHLTLWFDCRPSREFVKSWEKIQQRASLKTLKPSISSIVIISFLSSMKDCNTGELWRWFLRAEILAMIAPLFKSVACWSIHVLVLWIFIFFKSSQRLKFWSNFMGWICINGPLNRRDCL